MAVLIKDMEMPESCGLCKLYHAESPMYCMAVDGHKTVGAPYGMPRPDWCPLVEVAEVQDAVSRQAAIDALERKKDKNANGDIGGFYNKIIQNDIDTLMQMPPAQPEIYKEKLNEIASALSEKFAYMNTCPNERDIILGYLGVKRCCNTHCNTDCTNTKCESHPLSSAQPDYNKIIAEIKQCISETREHGKHHAKFVQDNGELYISGLEMALSIIEENR